MAVGVATQVAQLFMTRGLQREPAARANAVSYLQIVFAALWGVTVLGEVPDARTLAGAGLIVGSTLLLERRARPSAQQAGTRGQG